MARMPQSLDVRIADEDWDRVSEIAAEITADQVAAADRIRKLEIAIRLVGCALAQMPGGNVIPEVGELMALLESDG